MHKFVIDGGLPLSGTVEASGSKNSALPLLFASILSSRPITFQSVPALKDIQTTISLLQGVGAKIDSGISGSVGVHIPELTSTEAPYDLVRTMRASILMLGPLLARAKKAKVSLPGGCAIGSRPVDLHLAGLEALGAELSLQQGYVVGSCVGGLRGSEVIFRSPSVGATEQLMMAAVLARGRSVLRNCAREPEIEDLASFLNSMGANVLGAGTSDIEIHGVDGLSGSVYKVMPDRIEAGTLLLTGLMTGGTVKVTNIKEKYLSSFLFSLKQAGAQVVCGDDSISVGPGAELKPISIKTEPFPGFPTDLQAQLMAYLATVPGTSLVVENIFENRFMHVPELNRMGAKIEVSGSTATIHGCSGIYGGAVVMATDLRASASLVLAGLAAKGQTQVRRIYHLDRGYEGLEKKLCSLGARVLRQVE